MTSQLKVGWEQQLQGKNRRLWVGKNGRRVSTRCWHPRWEWSRCGTNFVAHERWCIALDGADSRFLRIFLSMAEVTRGFGEGVGTNYTSAADMAQCGDNFGVGAGACLNQGISNEWVAETGLGYKLICWLGYKQMICCRWPDAATRYVVGLVFAGLCDREGGVLVLEGGGRSFWAYMHANSYSCWKLM